MVSEGIPLCLTAYSLSEAVLDLAWLQIVCAGVRPHVVDGPKANPFGSSVVCSTVDLTFSLLLMEGLTPILSMPLTLLSRSSRDKIN